jgi:diaminopimelate epimerase
VPHWDDSAILSGMRIDFTKMHGTGNDFIVFDSPAGHALPPAEQLRKLADRRTGIGFDQALVLEKPRRPDTAVFYRIFNADGTEVEQCGNGARCIAALLYRRGQTRAGAVTMDSPAGLIHARVQSGSAVSVDMGVPSFEPRSLPFDAPERADTYSLDVGGQKVEIGAVSMGNPHAVLTVDSAETAPVEILGPAIEKHLRFPNRVNAGFVEIIDRSHIRLRVYERGVGETLACGTGACAAVAVERKRGLLDASVLVRVRGGELRVNWERPGDNIWLTGPAEVSFEGHVEV